MSTSATKATKATSPVRAITSVGLTDVGKVRTVNQDAYGEYRDADGLRHLLLVADGMGGHRGGEVASQMTVDTIGRCFESDDREPGEFLRRSLLEANTEVFERSRQDADLGGMGTTAVALLFDDSSKAWIAHVGDSRAYRLRGADLKQLTDDHSVVGELVRRGQLTPEEARVHPQSNEILRAIGTQSDVEVGLQAIDVEPGDLYLLCSDGLSGMLPDPEIAEVLLAEDTDRAARILVERANLAGGTDNITVQIAAIDNFEPAPRSRHGGPRGDTNDAQPREGSGALPWIVIGAVAVLALAIWLLR